MALVIMIHDIESKEHIHSCLWQTLLGLAATCFVVARNPKIKSDGTGLKVLSLRGANYSNLSYRSPQLTFRGSNGLFGPFYS